MTSALAWPLSWPLAGALAGALTGAPGWPGAGRPSRDAPARLGNLRGRPFVVSR